MMKKRLFFMDIDGTLALGKQLLPGTADLIREIRERNGICCFLTNNSSRGVKEYVERFAEWGIRTDREEFLTAGIYGARWMKKQFGDKKIFLMGSKAYTRECEREGLNVTDRIEPDIEAILTAYDTELTYTKLKLACELLLTRKIPWYSTNPDLCCPSEFGMVPDCGSISRMLETSTNRTPHCLGKPDPGMIEYVLRNTGCRQEEALVVGDRLYTDIACGQNAGVETCLVLTGEETEPNENVDYCLSSVADLARLLSTGEI